MKIGCCVIPEDIEFIAELGYDFAELPGAIVADMSSDEFASLKTRVASSGIPCLRMNSSLPSRIKICGPGFSVSAVHEYANILCSRAQMLGVEKIGIGSPKSRADIRLFPEHLAWEQAREFMETVSTVGEQYNVEFLWETLNIEETSFGIGTLESVKRIVAPLAEKKLKIGIVADFYHMDRNHEGIHTLLQVFKHVGHIHIAGNIDEKRGFPDYHFFKLHEPMFKLISANEGICISVEAFQGNIKTDAKQSLAAYKEFLVDSLWNVLPKQNPM